MQYLRLSLLSLLAFTLVCGMAAAQEGPPHGDTCATPTSVSGGTAPEDQVAITSATPFSDDTQTLAPDEPASGAIADAATTARVLAGIEHFVACRNAGDYAAYAALLTPRRMLAEAGTTNPADVIADLDAFNLPITIISLGDVRVEPDGRLSAEFVHLFGPHLYYRSRIYVVEEDGAILFDEEQYLPEAVSSNASTVDIQLTDFAFALSQPTMPNDQFVVLRATNGGNYAHEIIVVMLPAGVTVEQALTGAVPEEAIAFFGQARLAPGQTDDLVLVNMEPGTYTLLCLAMGPDGVPHAARGMVSELTLEGSGSPTP